MILHICGQRYVLDPRSLLVWLSERHSLRDRQIVTANAKTHTYTPSGMYSHHRGCYSQVVFLWVTAGCWSLSMAVMPQSQVNLYFHENGDSHRNGEASITTATTSFLASNALFGPPGPMVRASKNSNKNNRYPVVHLTEDDTDDVGFCHDDTSSSGSSSISELLQDAIVLVPRGNCSYEQKTWKAQQHGAKGVILYNTLASRYGYNETTLEITWPLSQHDYDCNNGMAYIPMEELDFYSNANNNRDRIPVPWMLV